MAPSPRDYDRRLIAMQLRHGKIHESERAFGRLRCDDYGEDSFRGLNETMPTIPRYAAFRCEKRSEVRTLLFRTSAEAMRRNGKCQLLALIGKNGAMRRLCDLALLRRGKMFSPPRSVGQAGNGWNIGLFLSSDNGY